MMDWLGKQEPAATDKKSRLRRVFAAPTAWGSAQLLKERFGIEAFLECFGQTEICMPVLTPYGRERPAGAVGLAVDEWFEIRIADPDTDEPVPDGQVGEFQIRPRENWILNSGYFGRPDATAEVRRNLWYHTGDAMRRDDEGWYYFVDRLKDCLRRRGENISSYEVEQPAQSHPAVLEVAAVGLPADEEAGEDEVGLFIVLKAGVQATPAEIGAWMKDRLPQALRPRFIRIVDAFPMTPSGKVQKAAMRNWGRVGAWDALAEGVGPQ
jgi:crotonobetaine/carnitine-CoA ligase